MTQKTQWLPLHVSTFPFSLYHYPYWSLLLLYRTVLPIRSMLFVLILFPVAIKIETFENTIDEYFYDGFSFGPT